MRPIRSSAARFLVAGLAGVAVAATAAPAAGAHGAATHAKHPKGFFIASSKTTQKVESYGTAAAALRDTSNIEHVVTTRPSASDPTMGHIVYLTKRRSDTAWHAHSVPGLRPLAGGVQVELHLSTDNRRVFAVLYECDGVFVTDAATRARRLPVPTSVVASDTCATPTSTPRVPPVNLAVPVFGHQIGVLLPDPLSLGTDAVYVGRPDATFTPGDPVPTTDGFSPVMMTLDPVRGTYVVVGTGNDGTNDGIYETSASWDGGGWSPVTRVAGAGFQIESVQARDRHIYLGLQRTDTSAHPKHVLFLDKGQTTGQWTGALPFPRTGPKDRNLRLQVNEVTAHLHAAWTRVDRSSKAKKSGIYQTANNGKGFIKPVHLTHWYRDVPTQITLTTPNGGPYVGYYQR